MNNLTDRERDILAYIAKVVNENGYSPSVRDIKAALSIRSTSTVHTYLQRLEEKGVLTKENGKSRTLRVEPAYQAAMGLHAQIPILGRVTAGVPILATENFDGYVNFPTMRENGRTDGLFALRVYGTSMVEAGILDGDVVIVEKTETADSGQIVVAMIEDEATVKTFYKENGHYRLQPENSTMQPIIVDSVEILGRVITSVRYYQ
jgi:repressor LexA